MNFQNSQASSSNLAVQTNSNQLLIYSDSLFPDTLNQEDETENKGYWKWLLGVALVAAAGLGGAFAFRRGSGHNVQKANELDNSTVNSQYIKEDTKPPDDSISNDFSLLKTDHPKSLKDIQSCGEPLLTFSISGLIVTSKSPCGRSGYDNYRITDESNLPESNLRGKPKYSYNHSTNFTSLYPRNEGVGRALIVFKDSDGRPCIHVRGIDDADFDREVLTKRNVQREYQTQFQYVSSSPFIEQFQSLAILEHLLPAPSSVVTLENRYPYRPRVGSSSEPQEIRINGRNYFVRRSALLEFLQIKDFPNQPFSQKDLEEYFGIYVNQLEKDTQIAFQTLMQHIWKEKKFQGVNQEKMKQICNLLFSDKPNLNALYWIVEGSPSQFSSELKKDNITYFNHNYSDIYQNMLRYWIYWAQRIAMARILTLDTRIYDQSKPNSVLAIFAPRVPQYSLREPSQSSGNLLGGRIPFINALRATKPSFVFLSHDNVKLGGKNSVREISDWINFVS